MIVAVPISQALQTTSGMPAGGSLPRTGTSDLQDTGATSCLVIVIADLAVIRLDLQPDNLGFEDTTEAQMASVAL